MNNCIIGLDIGTSSVKGVLASVTDGILSTARVPFDYDTDDGGKVEISAEKYINSCYSALGKLAECLPGGSAVAAVCASSASGNMLFLDGNFKPLTPIINWQDTRTSCETEEILGKDFDYESHYRSTGWAFDGKTFPLASLCRLKLSQPELFSQSNKLCMSTEYLYYTLTGNWGLSKSAGTPFYLIDQLTGKYREDILEVFGLSVNQLPPVLPTAGIVGRVSSEASKLCGLPEGVPVVAGTFDHPSAARGVGVLEPGQLLLSCGTSWVGFFPVQDRKTAIENKMLVDPFLSENELSWAGMVSLASVAGRIQSYIEKYICSTGNIYKTFESYSAESEHGAGGLKINLENDDEDYIRSYPKKHIARAIMECVVNKLNTDFDRLKEGGIAVQTAYMVGGPTECPLWTEIIENITGIPVKIRHGAYAGAVGAAMIGGIGTGIWQDEKDALQYLS